MKPASDTVVDFPALVEAHHPMVWRYLRLLGCESALADDLAQEVFLHVFHKPPVQVNESATASYLRLVARHKFIDVMRRQRRECEFDVDEAERVFIEARHDSSLDAWTESLHECLGRLDARPRKAIDLRYKNGRTIRQTAEALGMRESGVKTLLGRVKKVLRDCIQRRVSRD